MRAEIVELKGTLQMLYALLQGKNPQQNVHKDNNDYRALSDKEKDYRITRLELQAILGVSERTTYRRIKEYNIVAIEENGDTKFILGDVADIISRHGLSWHPASLNDLLARREIRYKPRYI